MTISVPREIALKIREFVDSLLPMAEAIGELDSAVARGDNSAVYLLKPRVDQMKVDQRKDVLSAFV